MANETLITDLVSQQALDQLRDLDTKMESTLNQFKTCATELAKGLKIPVEVSGDLERLKELSNTVMRQAAQATQQYTQQLQQQQLVLLLLLQVLQNNQVLPLLVVQLLQVLLKQE